MKELFGLTLSAVLLAANSVQGHGGDRVLPIVEISEDIVDRINLHDNSIEDWQEMFGAPTATILDFQFEIEHSEISDFSLRSSILKYLSLIRPTWIFNYGLDGRGTLHGSTSATSARTMRISMNFLGRKAILATPMILSSC